MKQAKSIEVSRRSLFAMAGLSAGATLLARRPLFADEQAKPADATAIKPVTNTSFASLKQIDAGVLNVGYAETRGGTSVIGIGPGEAPAVCT